MPLPPGRNAPLSAGAGPDGKAVERSFADTRLLQPLPDDYAQSPKSIEVVVWSDDLAGGEGGGRGGLSIRALLNYFERIRTLSLGRGPDGELGLRRLHREGVSVVVRDFFLPWGRPLRWWNLNIALRARCEIMKTSSAFVSDVVYSSPV